MRCERDRTTADEKRNWAEHGALWYAWQPFCRARHEKRKFGCFVLWLSSGLTWHGLALSHMVKIRTECVYVCARVCVESMCAVVYICGKGGEEEDNRMAILLF